MMKTEHEKFAHATKVVWAKLYQFLMEAMLLNRSGKTIAWDLQHSLSKEKTLLLTS